MEIALHAVGLQQRIDLAEFGKRLVDEEANIGREFQIELGRDAAADETLMAIERLDDLVRALTAERHDVGAGVPQVGRHADLGHGDDRTG